MSDGAFFRITGANRIALAAIAAEATMIRLGEEASLAGIPEAEFQAWRQEVCEADDARREPLGCDWIVEELRRRIEAWIGPSD